MSTFETYLKDFHREYTGSTSATFNFGKTTDGKSSYDVLIDQVPQTHRPDFTLVDLACGDGLLLQKVLKSRQAPLNLAGVDMSADELAAARIRLGPGAKLIDANARKLPFDASSVDLITCHLAFMLMDRLDDVVSELHRVLKPGGAFAAMVGDTSRVTPVNAVYVSLLKQALDLDQKSSVGGSVDPRTKSDEGLRSLFKHEHFEQPIELSPLVVHLELPAEELLKFFMSTYDAGLLSPETRNGLRTEMLKALGAFANPAGMVQHEIGLRLLVAKKRSS